MTFEAEEIGVESGRPVELYRFTVRATSFFYTTSPVNVTVASQVYQTRVLNRSNFAEGIEKRDQDFTIDLPSTDDVAELFIGVLTGDRVFLRVQRYHLGDGATEVITVFDGVVHGASYSDGGKICTLAARPKISSVGRIVPRRTCQATCNHVLYDDTTCRVDDTLSDFRSSAVSVTSQVGSILTVGTLEATFIDGWANGGFVEDIANGDFRLIIDQVGSVLTLLLPFASVPTSVNVFAGCDHTIGGTNGCGPKFDNVEFFGGFPFIALRNPFESGLL